MNGIADFFLEMAGHHLWQALLLALLLVALPARVRRWNAGTRYWLATMALIAIVLMPLTTLLPLPRIDPDAWLSALDASVADGSPVPAGESLVRPGENSLAGEVPTTLAPVAEPREREAKPAPASKLRARLAWTAFLGWSLIAGWLLLGVARQLQATRRLIRDARPVELPVGAIPPQAASYPILSSEQIRSPLAVGLFRRSILLPDGLADRLSTGDLRQVLVHEAAHLDRRDTWFCLLQRTVVALCFFHPVVHWIARRMELERETSCDDRAAVIGDRREYAACLLKVCESMQGSRNEVIAVGALTSRSQLTKRIRTMMDNTRNHQIEASKKTLAGFTLATLSLVVVLAMTLPTATFADDWQRDSRSRSDVAIEATGDPTVALIGAAWEGDLDEVRRLLDSGADPNGSQHDREFPRSPLNAAARNGNVDIVRLLLDRGADADRVVRGDATPLMAAARHGNYAAAALLIDRGADVNRVLSGDGTALINAARGGYIEIVELLLDHGADPNRAVSGDGALLIAAARSGNDEIVELLLRHGADADIAVSGDGSSLIEAARQGNLAAVRRLVEGGANVNKAVRGDGTPLIEACRSGNPDVVDYLLRNGADPDRSVSGDGSPLIEAARAGDERVVSMLLEAGADPDMAVSGDGNPLIMASLSGQAEIVRELLRRGADPNGYVRGDETPLINAAQVGHIDVAEILIAVGADVNLEVQAGSWHERSRVRSPLSEARRMGHDDMVDLLVRHGAKR